MGKRSGSNPFFLLSFVPALAYWLLETYSTLEVALVGGIILGLVEMGLEKRFTGHVHTLSKLNVALVVSLGGISLIAREGLWFKLQPTLTGVAVASFLLFKKFKDQSLMLEMLRDMGQPVPLPQEAYKTMELHLTVFLLGFAAFMAFVAVRETTAVWLFWKTAGFYIVFGSFAVFEFVFLRWYLRRFR